jgi:phage tail-like protein
MGYYPPPAFQFKVAIAGSHAEDDAAFSEVSGLDAEIEIEEIKEGGENGYVHRLPGRVKYGNLVLKRGILVRGSGFAAWCRKALEAGTPGTMPCQDLNIFLLDDRGAPLLTWHCARAWPVKWSIGPFNASQNEVAVETMEFAFRQLRRT